jgi:hypothetical protein
VLWSGHPRELHCDAAGPEVKGTIPNQVRCNLLLVVKSSRTYFKAMRKVGFMTSLRHYLFLMIFSRSTAYLPGTALRVSETSK